MKRKVLIITDHNEDYSVELVLDNIVKYGHEYVLLSAYDILNPEKVFYYDGEKYSVGNLIYSNFYSLWFWRFSDNTIFEKYDAEFGSLAKRPELFNLLKTQLRADAWVLLEAMIYQNSFKKTLVNLNQTDVNKLVVLNEAKKVGLKTPSYLVTTLRNDLQNFASKQPGKKVVVKDLNNPFQYQERQILSKSFVEMVTLDKIASLPSKFMPSFFQEKIEKKMEIRTFIINNECFSMAYFTQNNTLTKIDSRKYDIKAPSRCVPYKLEHSIEKKLLKLMNQLNLVTGSADLIYSVDNECYFLEINPIGRFGNVSGNCGYNLEQKIAQYLIS